jgi:predicted TIM-barrel fold metal-dependent hydrolase
MPVIDADTHVDETDETWDYLDEAGQIPRPPTVMQQGSTVTGGVRPGYHRYWFIDGAIRLRRIRDDARTGTTEVTRELTDVAARLAHMDEMGVDVHILYTTLFLDTVTAKPEVEVALFKAYNRWLAAKSKESNNRLRYVAQIPLLDMDKAIEEMHFAKANGACGFHKKGVDNGNRLASDPYFFPFYEEASKLGLPVCFHTGRGFPEFNAVHSSNLSMWHGTLPIVDAFHNLITHDIPQKFPDLRWGFIEATASWLPFMISSLTAAERRLSWQQQFNLKQELLKANNFFIACQTQDPLSYLIDLGFEDNLVIGSDYTHADGSAELEALRILKDDCGLSSTVSKKILEDNPAALYGIS